MSVKLTREGKQCKLCLKKGGLCHVHAGKAVAKAPKKAKAPAKRAAKKAKSKAKAKAVVSNGVDRFATLPKDALTLILLAMDRPELTKIRKLSKRARLLSDSAVFKDQYRAKHPTNFFIGAVYVKYRSNGRYIISDSHGHSVLIKGRGVEDESDSRYFSIDWMGYRTTALPKRASPKSRTALAEDEKEANYKPLKPKTKIQSQIAIINEAIYHLTEELELATGEDKYIIIYE